MPTTDETIAIIEAFGAENDIPTSRGGRHGEVVLELPGDHKLKTVCSLLVGDDELSVSAFVVRNPDENHLEVYRYLLRRNLRLPGLGYAIDRAGDVYVVGRFPLAGVDREFLDRVCGVVLEACDAPFDELLVLGFLTSMKREWAWRVSRGESLRNLEAFRPLLEGTENDTEKDTENDPEMAPPAPPGAERPAADVRLPSGPDAGGVAD